MMNPPNTVSTATTTTTQSALANFLGEILNHAVDFEIQNDNARLLPAGSCCTRRKQRRQKHGPLSSYYDLDENENYYHRRHHHHRQDQQQYYRPAIHKQSNASARWETQITNNDFIVTAPSRTRRVYCEPEKLGSNYLSTMRSAQIPLKEFTVKLAPSPTSSHDLDGKKPSVVTVSLTSNLLNEALDILADDD
jgi:hypothetical protein